jgi:hypothetical protein
VKRIVLVLLVAMSFSAIVAGDAAAGGGLTLIVDRTTNESDFSAGDNRCDTEPDPVIGDQCSLRAAIMQSNATTGVDSILFNIPGPDCPGGLCTIQPNTFLPS